MKQFTLVIQSSLTVSTTSSLRHGNLDFTLKAPSGVRARPEGSPGLSFLAFWNLGGHYRSGWHCFLEIVVCDSLIASVALLSIYKCSWVYDGTYRARFLARVGDRWYRWGEWWGSGRDECKQAGICTWPSSIVGKCEWLAQAGVSMLILETVCCMTTAGVAGCNRPAYAGRCIQYACMHYSSCVWLKATAPWKPTPCNDS